MQNTRHCNGCNTTKDLTDFSKDNADVTGYTYRCKKCRNQKQKEWVKKNPDKVKILNLKHRETRKEYYSSPERKLKYRKKYIEKAFNIPYSQYEQMQTAQNNVCAICKEKETCSRQEYLSVDHNHTTGKVRGLLCNSCNRALGYFRDNPVFVENAKNYLILNN